MKFALLIFLAVFCFSCRTSYIPAEIVFAKYVKAERIETSKTWYRYYGDKYTFYLNEPAGEKIFAIIPKGKSGREFQMKMEVATVKALDFFDRDDKLIVMSISIDDVDYYIKTVGYMPIGSKFYVWTPR